MILLDTSVWIEYLKRNVEYKTIIDPLLRNKQILAFDFVFGELLQGAKENEISTIIGIWEILPKSDISEIGFYAGKYSFDNKLWGKGIGLIDCAIIYAAINSKSKLWTLDKKIINNLNKQFLYIA